MILPECQEKEMERVKVSGKTKIKCEQIAKAPIRTTYESRKLFGLSDSKAFIPQLNCN